MAILHSFRTRGVRAKKSPWIVALVIAAGLLLILRAVLPGIVQTQIERAMAPEYHVLIEDVDLLLLKGGLRMEGTTVRKKGSKLDAPLASIRKLELFWDWVPLLRKNLVARGETSGLTLNLTFDELKGEKEKVKEKAEEAVEEKPPSLDFWIQEFNIEDSKVELSDPATNPPAKLILENLKLQVKNISSKPQADPIPATVNASADVAGGKWNLAVKADPFAKSPAFSLDSHLKGLNLRRLNDFLLAYGKFDVNKGTLDVSLEIAAADGRFKGYVKPVFEDLDLVSWDKDKKKPAKLFRKALIGAGAELLENQPKDRLATKVPLSGRIDDPKAGVWRAVVNLLYNGFIRALIPGVEGTIRFDDIKEK